ncbi:MAG: DUF6629 family protein [Acidimicrobiales bacterium]
MCFNATASFAGAAVVGACGVATLTMVRRPREVPLALLPFAFGIHQALEGLTWLNLQDRPGAVLTGWAVHLWVLFAWALLPVWVPWAVWLWEENPVRRRWMVPLLATGGLLTLLMLFEVLQPGIQVQVVDSNLDYQLTFSPAWYLAVPYLAATCLTPMLSSHRFIQVFGVGNVIALSLATALKAADFSSLWCTFAAFLSIIILGHYVHQRRSGTAGPVVGAAAS